MNKPTGYDDLQLESSYHLLPPGNYPVQIMKAEESSDRNNNVMLKLYLEICDGEFKNYFRDKFSADDRESKTWGCIAYIWPYTREGKISKTFKEMCESIFASNPVEPDAIWGNNFCSHLKHLKLGARFRREQKASGEGFWPAKPYSYAPIGKLDQLPVPKDKLIKRDVYLVPGAAEAPAVSTSSFTELDDDLAGLPF